AGETQARTSQACHVRGATIPREELRQIVRRDPEPVILDPNTRRASLVVDRDADLPAGGRELDGVAQQVVQYALEPAKVRAHRDRLRMIEHEMVPASEPAMRIDQALCGQSDLELHR